MSLKQRKAFFEGKVRVEDGTPETSVIDIDVSEDKEARLVVDIIGRDALSTGTWDLELFGILGDIVTTVDIGSMSGSAAGTTQVIESDLFDVRGFDKIRVKLTYTRVATDYIDVQVWAGIPHQHGVHLGT